MTESIFVSGGEEAFREMTEGRCFTRACRWNKDNGCEKPDDSPCPLLWWLGDTGAGKGRHMARKWEKP